MSYKVLALRWRPRTFDAVVGQATVTRTLRNAIATGRIGHAFLLSGPRGVGKTTTARILAKALNCAKSAGPTPDPCPTCLECLDGHPHPCDACPACSEIAAGKSLDVQEIDGASNNSVEDVRELRESARYNPARDRFKIWIIDEVHMLSGAAFNALLKTLEEPPPKVKFIFATTEYHKIPDTILSRCQQYDFRLIPARELVAHLREVADGERVEVSAEALVRIARAAEGSVRDALSLFDQVLSFSGSQVRDEDLQALLGVVDRELLQAAAAAVAAEDSLALLELVERLSDYGADYRSFVRELILYLRELLLVKLAPEASPLAAGLVPEERERLRPLAEAFAEEDLLRYVDVLARADADLRHVQDPRVTLELALLKLVQLRKLQPFAELVARVERLARGGAAALTSGPARPAASSGATAAPVARPATRATGAAAAAPVAPAPAAAALPEQAAPAPAVASRARSAASAPLAQPAAEPAAAAPPALAGGEEAAQLLERILEAARSRPSLLQPLRGASARLEAGVLVLEVLPDFQTLAELHLDEYRDLARRCGGRAIDVRLGAAARAREEPGSGAAAPDAPQEKRRERLLEVAAREPAVQEVLDLFNGRVVDVRDDPEAR